MKIPRTIIAIFPDNDNVYHLFVNSDTTLLNFIQLHPLMKNVVQHLFLSPFFVSESRRFSAIAVEPNFQLSGSFILYIGKQRISC